MNSAVEETPQRPGNWTLIRDVAVFQFKLVVDGFRDLILLPASMIVGIVSLVNARNGEPGPQFYRLLAIGKQSEQWINLFAAMKNSPEDTKAEAGFGDMDIDDLVSRVETFVIDEYKRGGVTAQAKTRIEKALDALQRRNSKNQ